MSVIVIVDYNSICRFCLESKGALSDIFDAAEEDYLVAQIVEIADVKVDPNDDMPTKICHRCRYKIELSFEFKKMLIHSQQVLKDTVFDVQKVNFDDTKLETDSVNNETVEFLDIIENEDSVKHENSNDATAEEDRSAEKWQADDENKYPSIFKAQRKNQCLLCLEKYYDEMSLQKHVDEHVSNTDLEPYYKCTERNIYCKVCGLFFDYRFSFLTHQREHLSIRPFICSNPGCDVACFSNAALKQHMQIHAKKQFICPTCGVGFKRKADLRGHEIIHEDADRRYHCDLCGRLCKNRLTYGNHVKKHHMQPMLECSHCPKKYFSKSELRRHLHSHSSIKKFQCNACSCAYFSQSALNRHNRSHDQPKTHKCLICGIICNSWGEFVDHRLLHPQTHECHFKCPHCGRRYFAQASLDRHLLACTKKPNTLEDTGMAGIEENALVEFG